MRSTEFWIIKKSLFFSSLGFGDIGKGKCVWGEIHDKITLRQLQSKKLKYYQVRSNWEKGRRSYWNTQKEVCSTNTSAKSPSVIFFSRSWNTVRNQTRRNHLLSSTGWEFRQPSKACLARCEKSLAFRSIFTDLTVYFLIVGK